MNWGGESGFGLPSRPVGTQFVSFYCSSGAPILFEQQGSSHHVQIGQRTGDEQSVGILGHVAVAHLGKAEDALDDQKRMLTFGAHFRFVSILRALGRTDSGLLRLALAWVKSLALGASRRITSVCPT